MRGKAEKLVAVIPAAGQGKRLRSGLPKLLTPIGPGATIWTLLSRRLLPIAEHINVIVSPDGEPLIRSAVQQSNLSDSVTLSIQPEPSGMGDAIFRGFSVWSRAQAILIVWGDQVFVTQNTLSAAYALHGGDARTLALPVVRSPDPYTEYIFADDGCLRAVRQSREGEHCGPNGYTDAGTFVLSVKHLQTAWTAFLSAAPRGALTGEVNFLPFLPFLSSSGWRVKHLVLTDSREARGVNTPDDLEYLQSAIAMDGARS